MARYAVIATTTIIASPATNAETVIATTGGISQIYDGAAIFLYAFIEFTVGTSGISATLKLRRGTTTSGTLINVGAAATVAAGNVVRYGMPYVDAAPGVVAGVQYSLTLTVGSGAATSTVSDVCLIAAVL